MRVRASQQFSCATAGRKLETQLSTEKGNLVTFRLANMPMSCPFCSRQHNWSLIKYHRQDIPEAHRPHVTGVTHSRSLSAER
jgi:transposase-like protein